MVGAQHALGTASGFIRWTWGDGWSPSEPANIASGNRKSIKPTKKSPVEWGDYFHLFAKIFILNSRQSLLWFILDQGLQHCVGQAAPSLIWDFRALFLTKIDKLVLKTPHKSAQHGSGSGVGGGRWVLFQQRFSALNFKPKTHNTSVNATPLWDGFPLLGTRFIPVFSCREQPEGGWQDSRLPRHVRLIYGRGSRALPARKSGVFAVQPCYLQLRPGLARLLSRLCPAASQKGRIQVIHILPERLRFWEQRWV